MLKEEINTYSIHTELKVNHLHTDTRGDDLPENLNKCKQYTRETHHCIQF